jgi:hypothetical protein
MGDTARQAGRREVTDLRSEIDPLKQLVAEMPLKNRVLTILPSDARQAPALPARPAPVLLSEDRVQ